jgi:hypothetical protein
MARNKIDDLRNHLLETLEAWMLAVRSHQSSPAIDHSERPSRDGGVN